MSVNLQDDKTLDELVNWILFLGQDITIVDLPEQIAKNYEIEVNCIINII